jgi:hypothetical protein
MTAGRAIFTLAVPEGFQRDHSEVRSHYTFRIVFKEKNDRFPEAWFVNMLSGPDNLSDYTPLGMLNPETGAVRLTRNSRLTDESWPVRLVRRVFAALWAGEDDKIEAAGFELMHSGRCGRCGRLLTTPESIEAGLGPVCVNK